MPNHTPSGDPATGSRSVPSVARRLRSQRVRSSIRRPDRVLLPAVVTALPPGIVAALPRRGRYSANCITTDRGLLDRPARREAALRGRSGRSPSVRACRRSAARPAGTGSDTTHRRARSRRGVSVVRGAHVRRDRPRVARARRPPRPVTGALHESVAGLLVTRGSVSDYETISGSDHRRPGFRPGLGRRGSPAGSTRHLRGHGTLPRSTRDVTGNRNGTHRVPAACARRLRARTFGASRRRVRRARRPHGSHRLAGRADPPRPPYSAPPAGPSDRRSSVASGSILPSSSRTTPYASRAASRET